MKEINQTLFSKQELRCINWSEVISSGFLSLILAIFTNVYPLQQNSIAHASRLQDLSITNANRHLYERKHDTLEEHQLEHIQMKTLNTWRHVDDNYKNVRSISVFMLKIWFETNHLPWTWLVPIWIIFLFLAYSSRTLPLTIVNSIMLSSTVSPCQELCSSIQKHNGVVLSRPI